MGEPRRGARPRNKPRATSSPKGVHAGIHAASRDQGGAVTGGQADAVPRPLPRPKVTETAGDKGQTPPPHTRIPPASVPESSLTAPDATYPGAQKQDEVAHSGRPDPCPGRHPLSSRDLEASRPTRNTLSHRQAVLGRGGRCWHPSWGRGVGTRGLTGLADKDLHGRAGRALADDIVGGHEHFVAPVLL